MPTCAYLHELDRLCNVCGYIFYGTRNLERQPGYDGVYQVSTFGNVRSFYGNSNAHKKNYVVKNPRLLKFRLNRGGYYDVCLRFNNKQKTTVVHRLVGITFIPNPENKSQLNHIDGNKKNNRKDNLEWNTHSENIQHAFDNHLMDNVVKRMKAGIGKSAKLVLHQQTGIYYDSATEAAKVFGYDPNCLINRLNGYTKNNTSLIWA